MTCYTNGPGIDDPLVMRYNSDDYFYHKNHLGSIMEITNIYQATVKTYDYDAFGSILDESGSLGHNAFTYTGREYHANSGLYYYRARFYDPVIGRFITQDPIGHAGGMNLYAYVGNDPVALVDPLGLQFEYHSLAYGLMYMEGYIEEPGYLDANMTQRISGPVVATGGVMMSSDGLHAYAGAGLGTGSGLSISQGPNQKVTPGLASQIQAGALIGGAYGHSRNDDPGKLFGELGYMTPGVSWTFFYVTPAWNPFGLSNCEEE